MTCLLIGVIGSLSSCICNPEGQTEVSVVVRSGNGKTRAGGSCTGDASCKVCKNCKYCKHCSGQGGSCGVCR